MTRPPQAFLGASTSGTEKHVERSLENVHCLLLVENDAAVDRLDEAFADLKRALHP